MNCRGGPNSLSKNHISFRCKKTNPKTSLLYLLCLDHENLFLSIMLMQEVACFQSLQSRRFEARRGLGEARRGVGEVTPRTQNVLAQGQSETHRDSKLLGRPIFARLLFLTFFFRPTPDGSRQVVYQAGKTSAFCKFTELMQWQHQS